MKGNHLFSLKYLIKSLFVIIIMITSCEKIDVRERVDDRENTKDLVMEWGQSANGRWIPYLLNKAKIQANDGEMDQALRLFYSYMQILNTAKGMFKSELIEEINLDISKTPNALDSIYRANYATINTHLAESGVMDQLWGKYVSIVNKKLLNKRWKGINKLASNDPPADVSACNTKELFDSFFVDISLIPNFHTTPIFELMYLADESIHGCRPATLAQIGMVMSVVYSLQNPSPADCSMYGSEIEDLLIKHLNCPIEGEGGGEEGGGGDPYPPGGNVDCAGVPYGPAYIGTCGICIGGSTGITSCDDIQPAVAPRDKAPQSYPWRTLFIQNSDVSSFLTMTTPQYITVNGMVVENPDAYNCHYHSFGSIHPSDSGFDSALPKWATIPDTRGYSEVPSSDPIKVGDRILYFTVGGNGAFGVSHSGIVVEVDAYGYATKISSKMGEYQVIEHHPRDIPPSYGVTDPSITHGGVQKATRKYFRK